MNGARRSGLLLQQFLLFVHIYLVSPYFHLFLFFSLSLLHLYVYTLLFIPPSSLSSEYVLTSRLRFFILYSFRRLFSFFMHFFPFYASFFLYPGIGLTIIYTIVFDRFSLRILAGAPAIVAEVFVVFLCLQASVEILYLLGNDRFVSNAFRVYHLPVILAWTSLSLRN